MLLRLQNAFASMAAAVDRQEQTANNLANLNTVGYKRDRAFVEALNERLDAEGAPRSDRLTSQWADQAAGTLEQTSNPLDVALDHEGFFTVMDEASGEVRYTRAGRFVLDDDGTLRTPKGDQVLGDDGPITIPAGADEVDITRSGEIRASGQAAGTLQVVSFDNPEQLERREGATFVAEDMPARPVEEPTVRQGFIETSNVDPMQEMTEMISHYRLFESQQRMMRTTDDILGQVARDLGRF